MTEDLDRALAAVEASGTEFDDEADAVRPGWQGPTRGQGLIEHWHRETDDLLGMVAGGPLAGPGRWYFVVQDQRGAIVTQGYSSRRGWAMDGADAAFPVLN